MAATAQDAVFKMVTDNEFLAQFRADPDAALEEFDVTEAEKEALTNGNEFDVQGIAEKPAKAAVWVAVYVH